MLALVVLPRRRSLLADVTAAAADPGAAARARRTIGGLAAATGVFNLLWATVTVLMIVRPGSTTRV